METSQVNDSLGQRPITLEMIDWRGCPVVEYVPARVSGQPSFVGLRMPVSVFVEWVGTGYGIAEFAASYHVDSDKLRLALQYIENDPPVHVVELTDCPAVERGRSGEPVFKDTTFPVKILFDQIKGGVRPREFADRYGLDFDHVRTVLSYAPSRGTG